MNQFKDIYTGQRKVEYKRAVSVQKCIRAGGKHNDLDNVGFTARHHTFFEMLGNFSFGDYFKEKTIVYAWEYITKTLGLPTDRLHVSIYEDDDESNDLWEKIAPELKNGRIQRFGKKENFWTMGDVGPCGPCSEIHFDRGEKWGTGPEDIINGEGERFVEFWNLVFTQFDQLPDGNVVPLPKPSVDTGMGLERLASILQNTDTNYGIDLFQDLIAAISEVTNSKYTDHVASHHVIADHLRALTFAIADGAGVSNEGQGYVLRRILRRAARHGRLLGMHEPFIHALVPTLINTMSDAYPEIREKQSHIVNVIKSEEESFLRTLETGLGLFEQVAKKVKSRGSTVIDGDDVFKLYDTYGFPYDLTEIIANEQGLTLDKSGFDKAMDGQKDRSRTSADFCATDQEKTQQFINELEESGLEELEPTELDRSTLKIDAKTLRISSASFPDVAVILDRTPFYIEAGGQLGDTGRIYDGRVTIEVTSLQNCHNHVVHIGNITRGIIEDIDMGLSVVTAEVDANRRWDIMRNHTATHLAHKALRDVLGTHVKQSGSYVGPDHLRFDFSHHQPMTPDEIMRVEQIVNEQILNSDDVATVEMDIEDAKKSGATALFGEKYDDKVRVVSIADFSKELCGGTHVGNTSQIGPFFITLETGIASGVRRLEAITGREATKLMLAAKRFRQDASQLLGHREDDAWEALQQLKDSNLALEKEIKKVKAEMFSGGGQSIGAEQKVGSLIVITHDFGESDRDVMAGWVDNQKARNDSVIALGFGKINGKSTLMAAASSEAIGAGKINIGALLKEYLPSFGGRGGGKPNFAQGTVADDTDAKEVFELFGKAIEKKAKA